MLSKEQIQKIIEICGGDGHTIYRAEAFNFLPEEILSRIVNEYKSDGSGKGTIYDKDNKPIPKLKGVYGLDLLWLVANDMKANTEIAASKMGRGFQAQALTDAINKKLEDM